MSAAPAPHKPQALPFQYQFAAGAIAGITETLVMYPLDVVKTRMQLATGKTLGMIPMFKEIIAKEGASRLYRGIVPPLLMEAPKRATKFAANDAWGKIYTQNGAVPMTQNLSILTGMSAGATESFVVTPFELVKIRMQDKNSTFKGPIDVIKKTVAQNGILGLYGGMEATFWRHVAWNGGYFGCIFQIRALLPKAETKEGLLMNNFIAGSIGGAVGTALNCPFDVVKSRIQLSGNSTLWAFPELVSVFRQEGFGALYKGFAPKVLRLAPGGGVLLLVVEFTLSSFRTMLGPPYI